MSEQARITRNEVKKLLEVVIDDQEREENTERLLKALAREEELKGDLAAYRADINTTLKAERKTIKDMRASLDKGKDQREVDCEEVWNFQGEPVTLEIADEDGLVHAVIFPPNCITLLRKDTMEIEGEPRAITDAERQQSFLSQYPEKPASGAEDGEGQASRSNLSCSHAMGLRRTECGWCGDDDCTLCCRGGCDSQIAPCPPEPDECDPQPVGDIQPQEAA